MRLASEFVEGFLEEVPVAARRLGRLAGCSLVFGIGLFVLGVAFFLAVPTTTAFLDWIGYFEWAANARLLP
jgi:hypothetical protein